MNHYESVFILNPVLSESQVKETVKKFEDYLVSKGAEMIWKEDWGLKKLAYPIQKKKTGFYHLFEFKASPEFIKTWAAGFGKEFWHWHSLPAGFPNQQKSPRACQIN